LNTDLAAGYQIMRWLQPEIEFLYYHDFEKHGKGGKLFSMVFGLIVNFSEHIRADVGLVQDIGGSGKDQTTSGIFRLVLLT
jgi:hypothetical protein